MCLVICCNDTTDMTLPLSPSSNTWGKLHQVREAVQNHFLGLALFGHHGATFFSPFFLGMFSYFEDDWKISWTSRKNKLRGQKLSAWGSRHFSSVRVENVLCQNSEFFFLFPTIWPFQTRTLPSPFLGAQCPADCGWPLQGSLKVGLPPLLTPNPKFFTFRGLFNSLDWQDLMGEG